MLVVALVSILFTVWPRTYRSDVTLHTVAPANSIDDEAATRHQTPPKLDSRTVAAMLTTPSFLRTVVKKLGEDECHDLVGTRLGLRSGWQSLRTFVGVVDEQASADHALRSNLQLYQSSNSPVIQLSCFGRSPECAQRLAAVVSSTLQDYLQSVFAVRSNVAVVLQTRFDDLSQRVARQQKSVEKLTDVGPLTSERLAEQLSTLEVDVVRLRAKHAASVARVDNLKKLLLEIQRDTEPFVSVETLSSDLEARVGQAAEAVASLEVELRKKQTLYDQNHPQLKALQQQLEEARAVASEHAEVERRRQRSNQQDRRRESIAIDLEVASRQVAAVKAELSQLEQVISNTRLEWRATSDQEDAAATAQRLLNELQNSQRFVAAELTKAQRANDCQRAVAKSLRVLQPPTYDQLPVGPRISWLLAAIFGMTMLFGIFSVALVRLQRQSLVAANIVESELGIPLLATVPSVMTRDEALLESRFRNLQAGERIDLELVETSADRSAS